MIKTCVLKIKYITFLNNKFTFRQNGGVTFQVEQAIDVP